MEQWYLEIQITNHEMLNPSHLGKSVLTQQLGTASEFHAKATGISLNGI